MKNNLIKITIILVLIFTGSILSQHNSGKFGITVFGGVAFPYGDFGSTYSDKAGYAKTGFSALAQGSLKLNENVNWVSTVSLAVNSLNDFELISVIPGVNEVVASNYITNWIMTGFGFQSSPSSRITVYGLGQLGLLISLQPDLEFKLQNGDVINQSTKTAIAFGHSFGFGIKINKVDLSLRYFGGEPVYEQTAKIDDISNSVKVKLPASLFKLLIGFNI